jgi:hypothetical protein
MHFIPFCHTHLYMSHCGYTRSLWLPTDPESFASSQFGSVTPECSDVQGVVR